MQELRNCRCGAPAECIDAAPMPFHFLVHCTKQHGQPTPEHSMPWVGNAETAVARDWNENVDKPFSV